jgi:uncharacterized membrane protein (DUF106 family)
VKLLQENQHRIKEFQNELARMNAVKERKTQKEIAKWEEKLSKLREQQSNNLKVHHFLISCIVRVAHVLAHRK